jgi:hypothetical protein
MEGATRASTKTIKSTDLASTPGPTSVATKVGGSRVNSTDWALMPFLSKTLTGVGFGKRARESNGLSMTLLTF